MCVESEALCAWTSQFSVSIYSINLPAGNFFQNLYSSVFGSTEVVVALVDTYNGLVCTLFQLNHLSHSCRYRQRHPCSKWCGGCISQGASREQRETPNWWASDFIWCCWWSCCAIYGTRTLALSLPPLSHCPLSRSFSLSCTHAHTHTQIPVIVTCMFMQNNPLQSPTVYSDRETFVGRKPWNFEIW